MASNSLSYPLYVSKDVCERMRRQRKHAWRRSELAEIARQRRRADRTHTAQILRDDQVRSDRLQQRPIHEVQTATVCRRLADDIVDLARRQPALHSRVHHHTLARGLRRIVALKGHTRNLLAHAQGKQDLGRRRQKGANLHSSSSLADHLAAAYRSLRLAMGHFELNE